jgi:hypothetical protein
VADRVKRFWWVWVIGAAVAWVIMGAASKNFPIVNLEFAWTPQGAADALTGANLDAVRASIHWDFLFIAFYVPALFLGSLWVRGRVRSGPARGLGTVAAPGALVAGVADVSENLSMLAYLHGAKGWILLAGIMATIKFALVALALGYVLVGLVVTGTRRLTAR